MTSLLAPTPARRFTGGTLVAAATTVLWAAAVAAGGWLLLAYAATPGTTGEAANTWPPEASFHPPVTQPTLVMFLHPHCPCSWASVEQLNRLLVRQQGHWQAFVVFVRPRGTIPGWEKTSLWARAATLPGVTVVCDEHGRDQRRFGAATSGETFLFDAAGRLVFRGGMTPARGHVGDSAGQDALAALIDDPSGPLATAPVFGCPLTAGE
jgi:hypothetical protein